MGLFGKIRKTIEVKYCGACGSKLSPNDRFCGMCGTPADPTMVRAQQVVEVASKPAVSSGYTPQSFFASNDKEKQLGMTYKARNIGLHKYPSSYIAMDLETTGFDSSTDGILEIAGVKVVDGVIVDKFQTLVDTDAKMSTAAQNVNGITRSMLNGAPKTEDAVRSFIAFSDGMPLLGHNAIAFDRGFIEHACARIPDLAITSEWFDTMKLAKEIYGGKTSLESVCVKCGIVNENAHRALSDAIATHECYQAMRRDIAKVTIDARDFPGPSNDGPLSGEVVTVTGEHPSMHRHDVMQAIVDNGGHLSNGVTKKTTLLVNFEDRESGKVKKAHEYGIRIISGDELLAIVR